MIMLPNQKILIRRRAVIVDALVSKQREESDTVLK
jgi:hypothetical protein